MRGAACRSSLRDCDRSMTFVDALLALKDHSHIEHFRAKCDDANPDALAREAWRAKVIRMASGDETPQYPPIARQVKRVLGAAGRSIGAAVTGGVVLRSDAEQAACLAICHECEHFDHGRGRCMICGCFARLHARLAREHCPLPEPKW